MSVSAKEVGPCTVVGTVTISGKPYIQVDYAAGSSAFEEYCGATVCFGIDEFNNDAIIGARGWMTLNGFVPCSSADEDTWPLFPAAKPVSDPEPARKITYHCHRCNEANEYAEPNNVVNGIKVYTCRSCRLNPYR